MDEMQSRSIQFSLNDSPDDGSVGSPITSSQSQMKVGKLDELCRAFKWLVTLASQRSSWSAALIASELWQLLTHIGSQREILKLLKLHPLDEFAEKNPRLAFKYLVRDYLALSFTVHERASCLLHHYRRMYSTLPESSLRKILQEGVTLFEISNRAHCFALTMGLFDPNNDREGELSLHLSVDGKGVFCLSFTIVPGWVLKSEVAEILLISRLQGTRTCYPQIKLATKTFHEVGPAALLLAALQGIADAFRIAEIAAVNATNQSSYCEAFAASYQSAYDDFFTELAMTKTTDGFFHTPTPISDKPLTVIKQGHKLRTKDKRAFKHQIRIVCAEFFSRLADRSANLSSRELCLATVPATAESRVCPESFSALD